MRSIARMDSDPAELDFFGMVLDTTRRAAWTASALSK